MDIRDTLPGFQDMLASMEGLQQQCQQVQRVFAGLDAFNQNFGSLVHALEITSNTLQYYPENNQGQVIGTVSPTETHAIQAEANKVPVASATNATKGVPSKLRGKGSAANAPKKPTTLKSNGPSSSSAVISLKKIIEGLPTKYREQPHKKCIINLVKHLKQQHPHGSYMGDLVTATNVPKTKCIEYLNQLQRIGEVVRISRKGLLYMLDPKKYPATC